MHASRFAGALASREPLTVPRTNDDGCPAGPTPPSRFRLARRDQVPATGWIMRTTGPLGRWTLGGSTQTNGETGEELSEKEKEKKKKPFPLPPRLQKKKKTRR